LHARFADFVHNVGEEFGGGTGRAQLLYSSIAKGEIALFVVDCLGPAIFIINQPGLEIMTGSMVLHACPRVKAHVLPSRALAKAGYCLLRS